MPYLGGMICAVEGCDRPVEARGWCKLHYQRWYRTGDVQAEVPLVPKDRSGGPCSVGGCNRPRYSLGLCNAHYQRSLKGSLREQDPVRPYDDAPTRWWSKVQRGSDDECWPWLGQTKRGGYGLFRWSDGHQHSIHAHRYGYQLLVGPVPPNLHVDHLCRNPTCVNPAHLEPVTHQENNRRRNEALAQGEYRSNPVADTRE